MVKRISGGFDLRLPIDLLKEDPCLINQFLVPENQHRITTDSLVWSTPQEIADFLIGQAVGYPLGLPTNLDQFVAALHERGVSTAGLIPVCVTLSEATVMRLRERGWSYHFQQAQWQDELLDAGWRFLGFDTAELSGLCSGLKGIGYEEPSRSQLRLRFGPALNDIGLFSDAAMASEFADLWGRQIPSHAPFEVVGILVHDPLKD
jgi:hypothetical protein